MSAHQFKKALFRLKAIETWYRIVGDGEAPGKLPLLLFARRTRRVPRLSRIAGRDGRYRTARHLLRSAWLRQFAHPGQQSGMWTVAALCRRSRCGAAGARTGSHPPVGAVVGRDVGDGIHVHPAEGHRQPDDCQFTRQHDAVGRRSQPSCAQQLPPDVEATLSNTKQAGTTDSPEYQTAMQVFYDRHVCRIVPNPDYVQRSLRISWHSIPKSITP